jgi:hypothetical protein
MIVDESELIKVSFDKFDFSNIDCCTLFFSALRISTEPFVADMKLRRRLTLYFSEETAEQLYFLITKFGGKIHWD